MQRFNLHHIYSREKTENEFNSGRINDEKLIILSKVVNFKTVDNFFICGPEPLIYSAKDFSVKERTNLIGIQKALGAKNRFILFQFLFEAVILSIIGFVYL